jgi:hypothetical protein
MKLTCAACTTPRKRTSIACIRVSIWGTFSRSLPVLSAADKLTIRNGFLIWAGQLRNTGTAPYPPGVMTNAAVLLPHLGSATRDTREAMGRLATENLLAVLEGREPPTPVN